MSVGEVQRRPARTEQEFKETVERRNVATVYICRWSYWYCYNWSVTGAQT